MRARRAPLRREEEERIGRLVLPPPRASQQDARRMLCPPIAIASRPKPVGWKMAGLRS